jgi:WhiB family redox-sensing transcriptional regulator
MSTFEFVRCLLEEAGADGAWRRDAACSVMVRSGRMTTDDFFPCRGDREAVERALAVCATCVVQEQCRDYAIERFEFAGVWGAMTARQRRGYARDRRKEIAR